MADEPFTRLPLRGDTGGPTGAQPRRCLGNARHQPGQGRSRQPNTATERAAPVRVLGGAGSSRRRAWAAVRADDSLRRCNRASSRRVGRARKARHRSRSTRGLRSPLLHPRRAQAAQDRRQSPRGATPGTRARRALDGSTENDSPLVFPGDRGGYLDIHHFRPYQWRPAQTAAGIDPLRRVYDLRHTFATFALRAGISTFDLSRYMGASLTMIDRHYGHLARDGREHAIKLLDALNAPEFDPWTLVDARWTPKTPASVGPENESDD